MLGLGKRYRQANRARQILTVLARYGFGEITTRLEQGARLRRLAGGRPGGDMLKLGGGVRLMKALEELGPTFIKLGQILSTRPDILPHDYLVALSELQDRVPGMSPEDISLVIHQELGAAPGEVFAEFDTEAIAAASLAQVHRARLKTGEEVAVKVQRRGITDVIDNDLAIMESFAHTIMARMPQFATYDPVGLVHEFGRGLRKELDFIREGQNCDICRSNFHQDNTVRIPRIFWDFTRRRVLTMELFEGMKVDDFEAIAAAGLDRRQVAITGATVYMKMIYDHGFFQADPHPGNLLVQPDGRIVIFDYGMFSRISASDQHRLVDLLLAANDRRADLMVRLMVDAGFAGEDVDQDALRDDIQDLLDRYYGLDLKQIPLGQILRELLSVTRAHRLHIPSGFSMLLRGLAMVEGLGLLIDPNFNFVEHMQPFIERAARSRFGVGALFGMLRESRGDLEMIFHNLPRDLRLIFDRIKKGQIELVLNPDEFRKIGSSLEQSNNRLAVAIVIAALIVGSSLMVFAAPHGFMSFVPVVGIAGFIIAAVLGFWLLFTTIRGGRF